MEQTSPSSVVSRVWLGTVQLGMRYGLAQRQPTREEAFRLLDAAWDAGVRKLDTARVYGESEEVIGAWIRQTGRMPTVASKLPDVSAVPDEEVVNAFETALTDTLRLLGLDHIDSFLCHHAADFHRPAVQSCFRRAIADGRIGRAGVSGYTPEEGLNALGRAPRSRHDSTAGKPRRPAGPGFRTAGTVGCAASGSGAAQRFPAGHAAGDASRPARPFSRRSRALSLVSDRLRGTTALYWNISPPDTCCTRYREATSRSASTNRRNCIAWRRCRYPADRLSAPWKHSPPICRTFRPTRSTPEHGRARPRRPAFSHANVDRQRAFPVHHLRASAESAGVR